MVLNPEKQSGSDPRLVTNNENDSVRKASPLVLHARVVTGHGGGPDKTITTAPRFYSDFGYTGACVYLRPPGDDGFETIRERAREQNTQLFEVLDRGPFDFTVLTQAKKLVKSLKPAIWHGHDYKTNLLGLLLVKSGCRMRLVTTVHGWVKHTAKTPLYYKIDKLCLKKYEQVYCVSKDQEELCRSFIGDSDRLFLLDNGIDIRSFRRQQPREAAKLKLGLRDPENTVVIGAMGRLSAEKGFDVLIRAVSQLIKRGSNVRLFIAGEGEQRESLDRLISKLGMADKINLLGFRKNVIGFLEALDLFVLSSFREGLPNVLLEAMSLQVPVISTRVAGIPRLIKHDQNGLLVDCGSIDQLAVAIQQLTGNELLRARYAENGYRTVCESFSFEERARRQCAGYDLLLA